MLNCKSKMPLQYHDKKKPFRWANIRLHICKFRNTYHDWNSNAFTFRLLFGLNWILKNWTNAYQTFVPPGKTYSCITTAKQRNRPPDTGWEEHVMLTLCRNRNWMFTNGLHCQQTSLCIQKEINYWLRMLNRMKNKCGWLCKGDGRGCSN